MTDLTDWMANLKQLNEGCECYGDGDELLFEYSNQRCDACIEFLEEARNALPAMIAWGELVLKEFGHFAVGDYKMEPDIRTLRMEFQRILDESEKA